MRYPLGDIGEMEASLLDIELPIQAHGTTPFGEHHLVFEPYPIFLDIRVT